MADVVPADWVADRLGDVTVVDVREAWEYDGIGHVPGAVNVPFEDYRADEHAAERGDTDAEGMLPDPDEFAALLGEAGLTRDDEVVAYDDTHGVFAARLLVTLELYGHPTDRLHLLDGDYSAWSREHEVSSEAPAVTPTDYEVLLPETSPLVGPDEVMDAVESGAVVVDVREPWEYEEGHVPGAVQLDWRDLVDDDSRGLLPETELREVLDSKGIEPDRRIVLYCNTARRISHTYVVLRHLGYEELAFYEGSLTEWERAGYPVEE